MSANDRQVGGTHYKKKGGTQHWDYATEKKFDFFQYQITKYVERWRDKNGVQDLEKALHFLEKYIEVERGKTTHDNLTTDKPRSLGVTDLIRKQSRNTTEQANPFGYDAAFEAGVPQAEPWIIRD